MYAVRPAESLQAAISLPRMQPMLPKDLKASELSRLSVACVASDPQGRPAGVILLCPDKWAATIPCSYRVTWLGMDPESASPGLECDLLKAGARAVAQHGARRIHVPVRPRNTDTMAACQSIGPVDGVAVVVSLEHQGL